MEIEYVGIFTPVCILLSTVCSMCFTLSNYFSLLEASKLEQNFFVIMFFLSIYKKAEHRVGIPGSSDGVQQITLLVKCFEVTPNLSGATFAKLLFFFSDQIEVHQLWKHFPKKWKLTIKHAQVIRKKEISKSKLNCQGAIISKRHGFFFGKRLSPNGVVMCYLQGGSMAKLSACQTRNPAVLGLRPALTTTWTCFLVALSSYPHFTLVNSQLVCLRPVGILNNVMFNLKFLFQLFARPY